MKPLEVWTCQRAENLKKKSSKILQNNYAATMVSAARRQIIGGGGSTPINKKRRGPPNIRGRRPTALLERIHFIRILSRCARKFVPSTSALSISTKTVSYK